MDTSGWLPGPKEAPHVWQIVAFVDGLALEQLENA